MLKFFDQSRFIDSYEIADRSDDYKNALKEVLSSKEMIDNLLKSNKVDVLVSVTRGPAWEINHNGGDREARKKEPHGAVRAHMPLWLVIRILQFHLIIVIHSRLDSHL